MFHLSRQERFLLFALVAVLGIGSCLIALKRFAHWDLFSQQEHWRKVEPLPRHEDLWVLVKGAVEHEGIYHVPLGARVVEAVQKARPLAEADLMGLPLADFVKDGETLNVPRIVPQNDSQKETVVSASSKININTADTLLLDHLPGVGPQLAERIIDYRKAHSFDRIEDLLKVSGIGKKKFEGMKDEVCVK
ncbi:MAG: helix-hairpin-helix domain-containing protein [Chlamydiae bacterium]|nr:helix-hairpin-helix domain-containing protein [Chlamydiota bacterium]MBI3266700.1 helix-hairpin-helix domain-containing protein [Chlamydiota bacterium]